MTPHRRRIAPPAPAQFTASTETIKPNRFHERNWPVAHTNWAQTAIDSIASCGIGQASQRSFPARVRRDSLTAGKALSLEGIEGIEGLSASGVDMKGADISAVTQASISLINHQGNIGKTLDELGSSASVKTLLTAMVTGGVLAGMSPNLSPTGQPTLGGGAQSFTSQLGQNLQAGIARSLISTAINGGSLEDSLKGRLLPPSSTPGPRRGRLPLAR